MITLEQAQALKPGQELVDKHGQTFTVTSVTSDAPKKVYVGLMGETAGSTFVDELRLGGVSIVDKHPAPEKKPDEAPAPKAEKKGKGKGKEGIEEVPPEPTPAGITEITDPAQSNRLDDSSGE